MGERPPIANAPAAIMASQAGTDKTQHLHRFHHSLGHGALGVGRMVGPRSRRRRPAVARQISDHERKTLRERWRYAMPHHVTLWMTMKEQERWAAPLADAGENPSSGGFDPARLVAGKEIREIGHQTRLSRSTARQPMSRR